ncbi:hypothetical protein LXM25_00100 [Dyadobacter sp. LJ53]|uniref:hypothetical protein n=1 Tax=Dyadobacter chenwenxiniae TaxID=2906456 RepID=UPI001F46540E|nr:hypothetical protein [Dyadobacter chenwenxiniae]MCF0048433.1 hypothetical protein [Dyadobacter chenwenxiniae]
MTPQFTNSTPTKMSEWNGLKLVHCQDLDVKWGMFGQFEYDLNCILYKNVAL